MPSCFSQCCVIPLQGEVFLIHPSCSLPIPDLPPYVVKTLHIHGVQPTELPSAGKSLELSFIPQRVKRQESLFVLCIFKILGLSFIFWQWLVISGSIRELVISVSISQYLAIFCSICEYLTVFRIIWQYLAISGSISMDYVMTRTKSESYRLTQKGLNDRPRIS